MTSPHVSDRALLRFLERAGGLAVEQLRATLQSSLERAGTAAAELDASEYLIVVDDLTFVVREGVVTTILPEGCPASRARALARGYRGSRG